MFVAPAVIEMFERLSEKLILERRDLVEVHARLRKFGNVIELALGKQAIVAQPLRRNQQRIARVRRVTTVRRIAVAGRIEGQDLPEANAGALRPVEKSDQLIAEVADTKTSGQRRRMQQKAGGAMFDHPRASGL